MRVGLALLLFAGWAILAGPQARAAEWRHGVSTFGALKYPADFKHFDYVNPNAPRDGAVRLKGVSTNYDTVSPFTVKGTRTSVAHADFNIEDLTFDQLMTSAYDEPDAVYALVAEAIKVGDDLMNVSFRLNPAAKFTDGSPVTVADIIASFETLRKKAHPRVRSLYQGAIAARQTGEREVTFEFDPKLPVNERRRIPVQMAQLWVMSKAWLDSHEFEATTLESPLASGPYRVAKAEAGRTLILERRDDYWGKDLPVNRGRFNFKTVEVIYFRDRAVAFEGLKAFAFDFHEVLSARQWAQDMNFPAVTEGLVKLDAIDHQEPSGLQSFFYNLRRERFQDPRVRYALNLAFDFEWTNKKLSSGRMKRVRSIYPNSDMSAQGMPTPAELALLEPLRGKIPDEVFGPAFEPPVTDASGWARANLLKASALLNEAGWTIKNFKRVNARGERFTVEFLLTDASFLGTIGKYRQNLERLGISTTVRIIDSAQYVKRRETFDFDVFIQRYLQTPTPSASFRSFWHSKFANAPGSFNLAGVSDPAVDQLTEAALQANSREELITAMSALDRVVMWNHYMMPQWYRSDWTVAYWDRFGRPKPPAYQLRMIDTWWIDPAKDQTLQEKRRRP